MKRLFPYFVSAIVAAATALPASAQPTTVTPVETKQRASGEQIPVRVQLVVSRHQGEKKLSSTPYTLSVVANDNDTTSMRMGVDVAVPQTVFKGGEGSSIPQTSYSYRSVGTNIDCQARTLDGGLFKLDLAVSDTAVFVPEKGQGTASAPGVSGIPAFRTFTSQFNVVLKDGQTAQHTAATDPVSGEVLRVDVTLTVLK